MIRDDRAQIQIILASMIMFCLFALRYIAHVAGTPSAIAAAVGGSMVWRFVKNKNEVSA